MNASLRGLIAGFTGFAVAGFLYSQLQGTGTTWVRAALCASAAAIVAVVMLMILPKRDGVK